MTDGRIGLADAPTPVTQAPTDERSPAVAGETDTIAYAVFARTTKRFHLEIINVDSGQARQLTTGPLDVTPAWSPSHKSVFFAAPAPGRTDLDIFAVDVDGRNRRRHCCRACLCKMRFCVKAALESAR